MNWLEAVATITAAVAGSGVLTAVVTSRNSKKVVDRLGSPNHGSDGTMGDALDRLATKVDGITTDVETAGRDIGHLRNDVERLHRAVLVDREQTTTRITRLENALI